MSKTKQRLWTKVGGKEFFARMAANATNDGDGNEIAQTYATNDDLATKQDTLTFGYNSNSQIVSIDNHDLAPSTDSTVYLAHYTVTTGANIKDALNANKAVMCKSGTTDPPSFGLLGSYDLTNNKYQFTIIKKTTNVYEQAPGDIKYSGVFCDGSSWFGQTSSLTFKAPTSDGQVMKSVKLSNGKYDWALSTINGIPSSTASDADKVLTVNAQGTPVWTTVQGYATDPTIDDSLLLGQSDGSKTWTALNRDVFGTELIDDETGLPMLDEDQAAIYDMNATDQLWTSFAGHEFGARRAYEDQNGDNIVATYATKDSLARVASTGSYNDLTDKPTIPPGAIVDQQFDATSTNAQSGKAVAEAVGDKADKVSGASNGHLASLDANGNLKDSGKLVSDFATDAQGAKADSALQPSGNGSNLSVTPDGTSTGYDLGSSTTLTTFAQKFKNLAGSLNALAFKDTASYNDLSSGVQSSLDNADAAIKTIECAAGSNINVVGTPSVSATNDPANHKTTLTFNYLKGEKGDPGNPGINGTNGTNGTSAYWFKGTDVTGTGTDISAVVSGSKAGDMYLNSDTQNVYIATAANTWNYVCNIKGAPGEWGGSVDQTYNAISTNPQSGTAVAQAVAGKISVYDGKVTTSSVGSSQWSKVADYWASNNTQAAGIWIVTYGTEFEDGNNPRQDFAILSVNFRGDSTNKPVKICFNLTTFYSWDASTYAISIVTRGRSVELWAKNSGTYRAIQFTQILNERGGSSNRWNYYDTSFTDKPVEDPSNNIYVYDAVICNSRDASWINSGTLDAARIPTSLPNTSIGGSAGSVATEGAGTTDIARHVWFSDESDETKRVYNDNFTYNPVGNIVTANISGNASTATHLSAYGTCDTWDIYNYNKYGIIAETTFDIGSTNNGDGSLIQMECGNSALVKLKMNFVTRTDKTPAVWTAKVFVLESTQSLSWIKENIIIAYNTPTTNTVNIRIYVQFTSAYQVWRARQLDCQTGDVGYTNWRPWTFYQTHGPTKSSIYGTRATYILTSPIISTARAYFNNETGYRRLVKIVPSLTAVGDRVIKFSAIQTWAGSMAKSYEGMIEIRYDGSTWAWGYARETKFSSTAGNIVLWYNNTTHETYLVANCEGSYSSFNLRIDECLDLNGVDKSEDITVCDTDFARETSIPSGFSELTGA